MEQKDVNKLMEKSPEWRQKFNSCENCERLEKRIKVLEDALKDAIDSMDNDCDYEENHRSASEQARAALEVKP